MNKLNKMLLREIMKAKGQFIAAAAVIFAGIAMFSAAYMSYQNLKNSVNHYYETYRFLDYYADVQSLTAQGVKEIGALKGVKNAIGRISLDVGADMSNDARVTVRLISLPDDRQPSINRTVIRSGGYFSPNDPYSALVSRKFAEFHKLRKGDTVKTIINLKTYRFHIDGIVDSPEFVYAVKSETAVTPSAESFGVLYVKESAARSILGFDGTYNQLHVLFEDDVRLRTVQREARIDEIEDRLKPCGFIRGLERKDQLSYAMVDNEIGELEQIAYMFPLLFLSVAATIIYIMQRRIINNQRTLIGIMKALGYTDSRILMHYIVYTLLIALAGTVPAIFFGIAVGVQFTGMYNQIFSIPVMQIRIYWDILFIAAALSMSFCLMAGYSSAKRVLDIQPAQAMRSEVPRAGRRIWLERVTFLWKRIRFGWKMSIRNVFRSRQRTFFTIAGIMATIMFFMVSMFFLDSIRYILDQSFFVFQKQDLKVVFSKPAAYYDALELESIKGIRKAEPIIEVPVEIGKGWRKESSLVVGLEERNSFYRLVDPLGRPAGTPEKGILVAHSIAEKLSIKPGDRIKLKLYLGAAVEKDVTVAGIVKQYAGFSCFMNIKELGQLAGEGLYATGALLKVEGGKGEAVRKDLFEISGVETVEARTGIYRDFMQFMNLMYTFVGFMIFFGTIMGFAIIFNTTVINIMERRRELASLKVLGYTAGEVEGTILRENLMIGLIALIPGIPFGRFMCGVMVRLFSNEMFALEVVINPRTYIIAILSVFVFIIAAQRANRKGISGLDMVAVLKDRES